MRSRPGAQRPSPSTPSLRERQCCQLQLIHSSPKATGSGLNYGPLFVADRPVQDIAYCLGHFLIEHRRAEFASWSKSKGTGRQCRWGCWGGSCRHTLRAGDFLTCGGSKDKLLVDTLVPPNPFVIGDWFALQSKRICSLMRMMTATCTRNRTMMTNWVSWSC